MNAIQSAPVLKRDQLSLLVAWLVRLLSYVQGRSDLLDPTDSMNFSKVTEIVGMPQIVIEMHI